MAITEVKLGTLPDGVGGDTPRSAMVKINSNFGINSSGVYAANENAASRLVGTAVGNVMEVGAFGIGRDALAITNVTNFTELMSKYSGVYRPSTNWATTNAPHSAGGTALVLSNTVSISSALILPYTRGTNPNAMSVISRYFAETPVEQIVYTSKNPIIANTLNAATSGKLVSVLATGELQSIGFTVDANGVIKKASPIVKLFADKIELNDEAKEQNITFERLGIGDYLIKGSTGFAQEGWYIEMPKDANGNVLVAVVYKQLPNNDISVKTYAKKFDEETGDIVQNTDKPRDIPETRWVDLRLESISK